MDINLKLLSIQNPWWVHKGLSYDPVLSSYSEHELKWNSKILSRVDLEKDKAYVIEGPRGVGKTTLVKLMIKNLIEEKKINPVNIFYYSCDNINTYEQLNELIKSFLHWRRGKNKENNERLYIIIDEITLIKDWRHGIKFLQSAEMLDNCSLLLFGSSFSKGDKNIQVQIMSSLSFREFVKLVNPELYEKIKDRRNYKESQGKLGYYLDIYFLTGGFISAVNDFKEKGAVSERIYSDYFYWLIASLAKVGRDIILFRQIIEKIIQNLGKQVGYKTLSLNTKARTHTTVSEYVNILESLFAIKTICQRGEDGKPSKSKAKKIYFQDPFLFWVFYSHIYGSQNSWQFSRESLYDKDIFSVLIENVVLTQLIKTSRIEDWQTRVTYWRDNVRKRDINFVVKKGFEEIPILVRYNKEISSQDKKVFSQAGFKKGVIITSDKLELHGQIKYVPLIYFLLYHKEIF
jgi:hypothetical protein